MCEANLTETLFKGLATEVVWIKENFFDSNSSSLGDCGDPGAITGKGTEKEKTLVCFLSFANVELEVQGHIYVAIAFWQLNI